MSDEGTTIQDIEMDALQNVQWEVLVEDLTRYGVPCTVEQLKQPHWCFRTLGALGYSLRVTFITAESYLDDVKRIGKIDETHPVVKQTYAQLKEVGGAYTYQLQGGRYATRGSHNTFMLESLVQCTVVALDNVARLIYEEKQTTSPTPH